MGISLVPKGYPTTSTHLIANLYGIDSNKLKYVDSIKKILKKVVESSGINIVKEGYYQFKPYGVTGYLILTESHISIHTWPEHGSAQIDIFICGKEKEKVKLVINEFLKEFEPSRLESLLIER